MILAFDTSNYTTSICILENGVIVFEERTLVKVKPGDKGIRQSDAYFQHMQVLQIWVSEQLPHYARKIKGVAVSTKPRSVEGSYMPVFKAGELIGKTIANSLDVPFIETSHQDGHYMAALISAKPITNQLPVIASDLVSDPVIENQDILFLHLSGGTTELHLVHHHQSAFEMSLIADTADISFGQLVDRIGVEAGVNFPCGSQMDKTAVDGHIKHLRPRFKMQPRFNLSGYENSYKRLLASHPDHPEHVFYDLFACLSDILSEIIAYGVSQTGVKTVLIAGGVAASQTISGHLRANKRLKEINLVFSDPYFASDNSYGVCLIGEGFLSS